MIWLLAVCALAFGKWTYAQNAFSTLAPYIDVKPGIDGTITETDFLGDRMFTLAEGTYDASFVLQRSSSHSSCCGGHWSQSLVRNSDGTYDFSSESAGPTGTHTEHLKYQPTGIGIMYDGIGLLPWMISKTHATHVSSMSFNPTSVQQEAISTAHIDPPDGVPRGDATISVQSSIDGKPFIRSIWYDPCTFVVDAWTAGPSTVYVRSVNPR